MKFDWFTWSPVVIGIPAGFAYAMYKRGQEGWFIYGGSDMKEFVVNLVWFACLAAVVSAIIGVFTLKKAKESAALEEGISQAMDQVSEVAYERGLKEGKKEAYERGFADGNKAPNAKALSAKAYLEQALTFSKHGFIGDHHLKEALRMLS